MADSSLKWRKFALKIFTMYSSAGSLVYMLAYAAPQPMYAWKYSDPG